MQWFSTCRGKYVIEDKSTVREENPPTVNMCHIETVVRHPPRLSPRPVCPRLHRRQTNISPHNYHPCQVSSVQLSVYKLWSLLKSLLNQTNIGQCFSKLVNVRTYCPLNNVAKSHLYLHSTHTYLNEHLSVRSKQHCCKQRNGENVW